MSSTLVGLNRFRNFCLRGSCILLRSTTCVLTFACTLIALLADSRNSLCQEKVATHPFLSTAFVATQQQLQAPCRQSLESSFESVIRALSSSFQLPIWIDRHIARDQVIHVDSEEETLGTLLKRASQLVGADVVPLEGMVAIVPAEKKEEILSDYWRLTTAPLPPEWKRIDMAIFSWQEGIVMKNLAKEFSNRYGLKDAWVDLLEHDVWPGYTFDRIPAATICTCVLSGMDRTLTVGGSGFEVVHSPKDPDNGYRLVTWIFSKSDLDRIPEKHRLDWKNSNPNAVVSRIAENRWQVTATPTEHLQLVLPLIPRKKWAQQSKETAVYSGSYRGNLAGAIEGISKQLSVHFYPLPLPDTIARREIVIEYDKVSLENLLKQVGQAGGIRFQKLGERYEITILPMP